MAARPLEIRSPARRCDPATGGRATQERANKQKLAVIKEEDAGRDARRSVADAASAPNFQRGTAGSAPLATWEDQANGPLPQQGTVGEVAKRYNVEVRMPAMRGRQQPEEANARLSCQKLQRCALATRKSRNTWMRATDLSSSG